jgi:hypothetical protein
MELSVTMPKKKYVETGRTVVVHNPGSLNEDGEFTADEGGGWAEEVVSHAWVPVFDENTTINQGPST